MKNMIKRALAILVVLSLLPTLPIVASAANESVKTVYDFAEAFAIDTTNYSFANASADGTEVYKNPPLKYANSEASTSPWKVGYFKLSNNNEFAFFSHMSRGWYTTNRAPEDTVSNQAYTLSLSFGRGTIWKGPSGGVYGWQINGEDVGYAFAQNTETNSFPGNIYGTYARTRNAVRFVAPRDGIIVPEIKLLDDTMSFSGTTDGVLFKIYKKSGSANTPIIGGNYTATMDTSDGWELVPAGKVITTFTGDPTAIAAGDEVVLVFDPNTSTSSDEFTIYSYNIEYIDPIATYDAETYLTYTEGKINTVDLTRATVLEGLGGTVSYSLTDGAGVLQATAKPGIYTLSGRTNYDGTTKGTPAVLTASYTPAGGNSVICTTSTNIYVSTLKSTYDIADAFAVDPSYSFAGYDLQNTTVYQNLPPKYPNTEESSSPWKIGYYKLADGTFVFSTHLSKGWYTDGRAPEDTYSPANRQTRLSFGSGSVYKGPAGTEYGWQISGTTIGYGFKNNTSTNSFSGDYYVNRSQHAVRFVAPRAGLVSPTIQLMDSARGGSDGVLFKVYKKSGTTITPVYGGDHIATRDSSTGWDLIPESSELYTRSGAQISVSAGDEIVLRFDPYASQSSDEFTLYSYIIDYLAPIEEYKQDTFGYYSANGDNVLDLRVNKVSADDNGLVTYTVIDSLNALAATDVAGVYTMTGVKNYVDYAKGTPITVVASYYAEGDSPISGALPAYTSTTNLYIGDLIESYNISEAFLPADDFAWTTVDNEASDYSRLTAKYENSETSTFPWKIGATDVDAGNKFIYHTVMNRPSKWCRLIQDTVNSKKGYYTSAAYGTALDTTNGAATGCLIGYNYESGKNESSFSGNHNDKTRATIRFVVPRDGVINPVLTLLDKQMSFEEGSTTDGVFFRVYKKSGAATTAIYGGTYTSSFDSSTGWAQIPPGNVLTTFNNGKVGVKAGDEIVIEFDPGKAHWSDEFCIHTVRMNYVDAIANYNEITNVTYDAMAADKTVDLRIEKYVADGNIEYTVEDSIGALAATAVPGVYTLAGVTNYDGTTLTTPVKVTASYFATGDSSANGDAPICSTSTVLYISSVLFNYEPFGHYVVKTTNLDMAYDTFFLPYYTQDFERELYGTVDLDLNERWAGATLSFDKNGYLEDAGGGRVRVIGLYDHTKSNPKAADSTDMNGTKKARRDENTVGTPIKMTVTAPDGFSKSYYVLTFKAIVQDLEQDGRDVYHWIYGAYKNANNRINNAVMAFETVAGTNGVFTFKPMVVEPGALSEGTLIDLDAAGNKYVDSRAAGKVGAFNGSSVSRMGAAFNDDDFGLSVNNSGIAQTFTAPKSGRITVSSFTPELFLTWQSQYIGERGKSGTIYINLYDEDDKLVDILYKESWGPKQVNSSWSGPWTLYDNAVYSRAVAGTRQKGEIEFDVVKGQKVRVIMELPDMTGFSAGQGALDINRIADPIFTYVESELDTVIATSGEGTIISSTSADIGKLVDDAVCTYFGYDANGKLVGSGYEELASGTNVIAPSITGSAAVDYFKVFLWSDFETMRAVGGALILK